MERVKVGKIRIKKQSLIGCRFEFIKHVSRKLTGMEYLSSAGLSISWYAQFRDSNNSRLMGGTTEIITLTSISVPNVTPVLKFFNLLYMEWLYYGAWRLKWQAPTGND